MHHFRLPMTLAAMLLAATAAHARHPVVDGVIGYGTGKAIEMHQDAGRRLGYPPLMPPIPGPVSPHHQQMIEDLQRELLKRDLREQPGLIHELERRGRTG